MQVTLTEAAQIAAQCSAGKSMFMHVRSHGPFGTLQVRASHSCLLSDLIEQYSKLTSPILHICTAFKRGRLRWKLVQMDVSTEITQLGSHALVDELCTECLLFARMDIC
jgi:hypothetical protein